MALECRFWAVGGWFAHGGLGTWGLRRDDDRDLFDDSHTVEIHLANNLIRFLWKALTFFSIKYVFSSHISSGLILPFPCVQCKILWTRSITPKPLSSSVLLSISAFRSISSENGISEAQWASPVPSSGPWDSHSFFLTLWSRDWHLKI